jgi:enoyl-CoA hydratase/carnithine racemase
MPDDILVGRDGPITTITLNRPEKRNALTTAMIGRLHGEIERVAGDGDVRVLVLRSAGSVFCAGLDLRELAEQRAAGAAETHTLEEALHLLEALPQPTIAVVQGEAVAGGCELALHCDLRVAGDAARFSMPLARIGLAVPVRLVWKLVETIGQAATRELLFTGEAVDATAAHELGLVNRVVPAGELDRVATTLAQQIARNAPLSLRVKKASAQRLAEQRRSIQRDDLEDLSRQVRASADLQEGLAAQRERRAPVFRGR